jgi:hypothetical protein
MSTIFGLARTIPEGSKTISYSQFSLFNECPLKWKLSYIDKLKPNDPSIHLIYGTSMHETLQHYLDVAFNDSVVKADSIDLNNYLYTRIFENYKLELEKNNNVHFSNRLELDSFYRDGIATLDFIKKHRGEYFPTKNHKLLGIEIPLLEKIDGTAVYLKGFIDIVISDEIENRIIVYDFKTSTRGWSEDDKKNENKKAQIIIYKEYFAKQFGLPVDTVDVVFFILKRKIFEGGDFPQKRVQLFKPPSGKLIRKRVNEKLLGFVNYAFDADGKYRTDVKYDAITGNNESHCKYCVFKDRHDLCPVENRIR